MKTERWRNMEEEALVEQSLKADDIIHEAMRDKPSWRPAGNRGKKESRVKILNMSAQQHEGLQAKKKLRIPSSSRRTPPR